MFGDDDERPVAFYHRIRGVAFDLGDVFSVDMIASLHLSLHEILRKSFFSIQGQGSLLNVLAFDQ
ncbi:MAG TPA: hypothetical protein DF383_13935 [Deltaproteobacteria bacterium]|nr:hypothetical protein [Deltaproteobacteria bacterium]